MAEGASPVDRCDVLTIERPDPCALVLFGATGDLTRRKLMPALYSLAVQKLLPDRFAIVAFARQDTDDAGFRAEIQNALRTHAPSLPLAGEQWDGFAKRLHYLRSDLDDPRGYAALKALLEGLDRKEDLRGNRLFYLATPPNYFGDIAQRLGSSGLVCPDGPGHCWSRLVVEKPFGYDLKSARALNATIREAFHEDQVYRIDHYLGKETVQNILVMRFANRLFELLWSHLYIDSVQITVAETLGMEGRGAYFDKSGILRDVIQNHALQLLTLTAMEPPVSLRADAVRDEKVKVLRSLRAFDPAAIALDVVRGQYVAGDIDGKPVQAYSEEEGVSADTHTETFAALRFWVDNWRWAGVPFYVRAGKRLPTHLTEIVLQLKEVPDVLYARMECMDMHPNRLVIRVQPHEAVEIWMSAKRPGQAMRVQPVRMHFDYAESFGKAIPSAYEHLLLNAMVGDTSLFARHDEVETAWELVDPVLRAWHADSRPPDPYFAGAWGPAPEHCLPCDNSRRWWNPDEVEAD
ncbi:MAG: glucose-6-phosphate dehydrogenase [Chthonomonadales bacterium]|nr:glucose-6-phosphate dehydrogenase [Chthonomonadales bacterium]